MKITKEQLKTFGEKVLKYGYLPIDISYGGSILFLNFNFVIFGIKKNGEIDSIFLRNIESIDII